MFEAVILAGGQGSRLKSVSGLIPKPMVEINGKPFVYRLMQTLEAQGCSKIILSLCYQADYIIDKITADNPVKCNVEFCVEEQPLGTGGAIKLAAKKVDKSKFVVINGDTICELNYQDLVNFAKSTDLTISGVRLDDVTRYGTLVVDNEKNVVELKEKGAIGHGLINSGIYVITTKHVLDFPKDIFSFEHDYVQTFKGTFKVFETDGYFIDIGIPEDYYKACQEIK